MALRASSCFMFNHMRVYCGTVGNSTVLTFETKVNLDKNVNSHLGN